MVVVLVPVACCMDSPLLPFLAGQGPIYVTIQRVVQIHFKLRYIFVCYCLVLKVKLTTDRIDHSLALWIRRWPENGVRVMGKQDILYCELHLPVYQ